MELEIARLFFEAIIVLNLGFVTDVFYTSSTEYELSRIISGEALTCEVEGKFAVAQIYQRNKIFYGDYKPDTESLLVANIYEYFPDITDYAFYLVDGDDLQQERVRKFTIYINEPTSIFDCGDDNLYAFPSWDYKIKQQKEEDKNGRYYYRHIFLGDYCDSFHFVFYKICASVD